MRAKLLLAAALVTAAGLGLSAPRSALAAPVKAATDAYVVVTPAKPWVRSPGLEPAGQLSWGIGKSGTARALLQVEYQGILAKSREDAYALLLRRARASIRETLDGRDEVQRGEFEPDSMLIAGGLQWRGFRFTLGTSSFQGVSWRWYALHPDYPRRPTAFVLLYEETTPGRDRPLGRVADARTVARSLVAVGRGLDGDLSDAWLDARALAYAARIDSAQKLCWLERPDAGPGLSWAGYAAGAAGRGDFFQLTGTMPPDSLADPAPAEYGVVFDRNGDSRMDLVVMNRGVHPFFGRTQEPTVAIVADDDFDGRADGVLLEDVDANGDDRVDARLLVSAKEPGRSFTDAIHVDGKGAWKELPTNRGSVEVRRFGYASDRTDFEQVLRGAGPRLDELTAARARCAR